MLYLAFACLSLQRTRCLQEPICHNEKKIRSVHLAAAVIYAGLGNAIAMKARQRRSTHGGMIWSRRVSGSWHCRRLFRGRWNLVLPEYGVENNDDDDLGVESGRYAVVRRWRGILLSCYLDAYIMWC
jgi:hypothetical protein